MPQHISDLTWYFRNINYLVIYDCFHISLKISESALRHPEWYISKRKYIKTPFIIPWYICFCIKIPSHLIIFIKFIVRFEIVLKISENISARKDISKLCDAWKKTIKYVHRCSAVQIYSKCNWITSLIFENHVRYFKGVFVVILLYQNTSSHCCTLIISKLSAWIGKVGALLSCYSN